ncbi:ribosome biogenesis protein SLX9-domain-containing protein [Trichoderma sp. SZMC 28011]
MAPQKPSATALRHARITNSIHPLAPQKTFRANASTSDSFLSSKRDKRTIKHSSFVSRISSSSRISKSSKLRRGRGAKKSATLNSLDSLADALPELADGEGAAEILDGKIKHQSLRSKKGALKRKERLLKGEMARFGVSMAQLSHLPAQTRSAVPETEKSSAASLPVSSATTAAPAASNRWAALRGYISATMEQNPAFVNKE